MQTERKNILIISPFFFPEPISTGKFNTDMALALRDEGHEVKILCFHPFYPKWKSEKSNHKLEEIEIIRGGKNLRYSKNTIIRRIVLELGFSFFVVRKFYKLQEKTDIIIPIFPPSLAFYSIIPFLNKRIHKVGMIHDLQEIYSLEKKGFFHRIIRVLINKVEKKVYQSCDKLIFLSKEMKETAKTHYNLENTNLEVQYPFVTININNRTNDLDAIFSKNQQHIVYSGALGEKQNPKGLYELFNFSSKKLTNVIFHFFSQGIIFEELKNKNSNPKIQFHNLVPKKNIEELYRRSTIQIIPQLSGTSKGSLPSKLPNLLVSGCDILCITDKNSEIEKLFKKYNFNTVATLWDNEVLCSTLEKMLENKHKETSNNKKITKKLFDIDSMVTKILN